MKNRLTISCLITMLTSIFLIYTMVCMFIGLPSISIFNLQNFIVQVLSSICCKWSPIWGIFSLVVSILHILKDKDNELKNVLRILAILNIISIIFIVI